MNNPGINFDKEGKLIKEQGDRNKEIVDFVWNILSDKATTSNVEKYNAVSKLVRDWTSNYTTSGGYRGVPYFTQDAYNEYQRLWELHGYKLTEFSKELGSHFTHEHILPVAAAVKLFDSSKYLVTYENVREVLYNHVNAAVITKKEASALDKSKYKEKMPESYSDTGNIFERYSAVDFPLLYVKWSEGNKCIIGEPQAVDMKKDVVSNHLEHVMQDLEKTATTNIFEFINDGIGDEKNSKKPKSKDDKS